MPLVKAAKVVLPEFYIAFVLPNASREPTKKECEELRAQSIDFWTKRLNEVYSKTFKKLDLKFEKRIFGERPKMNNLADDLAPEFNMYLEVSGKALFSNKSTPPTYDMVFHQMAEGDSMDYLVEFVRKVKKDPSLFATAVEVRAKRLKVDPKGPGGTVKSPSFFVAFSTDPTLDPPTEEEVEEFRKRTHDNIVHHLKAKYPTNFVSCELKVTNVEVGQEKPDERFHLYLENECSATFSSNAPTEEELFSIILRCCNTRDYLMIMSTIDGSPFMTVTRVKCQMIGLDAPQAPEELKEPPKKEEPEKEEEEKEQEQEEGSEDEDDQEGEEDEDKEKPKDEPKDEPNIIEIDVPVFLALVVMAEPPAELPSQGELMEFHSLMERIFYTVLKNEYPDTLIDTTLKEKQTQFDAGVPEPRFKYVHFINGRKRAQVGGHCTDKFILFCVCFFFKIACV